MTSSGFKILGEEEDWGLTVKILVEIVDLLYGDFDWDLRVFLDATVTPSSGSDVLGDERIRS